MIKKIAVTGTKGKSTTLRLLESGFRSLDYDIYGTYGVDGYYYNGELVRDGSSCINYLNFDKAKFQVDMHLIEATSFTLDTGIFDDCEIDCAIFTSFDETEHTEIHQKEGSYVQAKRKIFSLLKPGAKAIVCRDIPNYPQIIKGYEDCVTSYGFHPEADYIISVNMINERKMVFSLSHGNNALFFKTKLLGKFNCSNIAAAYIAAVEMNVEDNITFFRALESFSGFAGRMERFHIPKTNTKIIIDYAHTHKSLEELLALCRVIYPSEKILTIFG